MIDFFGYPSSPCSDCVEGQCTMNCSRPRDPERRQVAAFLAESNYIEGITRVTLAEIEASEVFLAMPDLTLEALYAVQAAYAPGYPVRDQKGMDVWVGRYIAPRGGFRIEGELITLLTKLNNKSKSGLHTNPWKLHVAFERLHPFMDGNGRTGRILWAWHMKRLEFDPFQLSFLHKFYYQTLDNS